MIAYRQLLHRLSHNPRPSHLLVPFSQRIHPGVLGPSRSDFQRGSDHMSPSFAVQHSSSFGLYFFLIRLVGASDHVEPPVRPVHPVIPRHSDIRVLFACCIRQGSSTLDLIQSPRNCVDSREPSCVVESRSHIVKPQNIKKRKKPATCPQLFSLLALYSAPRTGVVKVRVGS